MTVDQSEFIGSPGSLGVSVRLPGPAGMTSRYYLSSPAIRPSVSSGKFQPVRYVHEKVRQVSHYQEFY